MSRTKQKYYVGLTLISHVNRGGKNPDFSQIFYIGHSIGHIPVKQILYTFLYSQTANVNFLTT